MLRYCEIGLVLISLTPIVVLQKLRVFGLVNMRITTTNYTGPKVHARQWCQSKSVFSTCGYALDVMLILERNSGDLRPLSPSLGDWYIKGCGAAYTIAIEGGSSSKLEDFDTGSDTEHPETQNNLKVALKINPERLITVANTSGSDSESMGSGSDSEEDSEDDFNCDDNDWSGTDNYFESSIFQAVYPNIELAAYLIKNLYSMVHPPSSTKVSRKVSSWRAQIYTSTTDSETTSTEKAPPASNKTSSTSKVDSQKRDRLSGSPGKSSGEDGEEDDDDDTDESRRKRLKEKHLGSAFAMPIQKLACPFFKMNPSKYSVQLSLEGQVNDKQYRICAGPGFKTIQLLK